MTKSERINLGLAIIEATRPGESLTQEEIAAYCDCSPQNIANIEKRALQKLARQGKWLRDGLRKL